MRIIYLTTARHPEDYAKLINDQERLPNPSNQNFHIKFISLLKNDFTLEAISTRPLEKGFLVSESRNDPFFYPGYLNTIILRRASLVTSSLSEIRKYNPDVIFVDVLNMTLLVLARRAKTLFGTKIIGIVTDNPMNITGARKNYSEDVFKYAAICDGYIALTDGLAKLFNPSNKPFIIMPGIINASHKNNEITDEYAFFAGALYEKYGVLSLIEAFKDERAPLKLTIAGHGPLAETLQRNPHPNIEFIGHVTPEVAFLLSQKAKININPRPQDEQIDLYSVPSKVLDYVNSETVTISTPNKEIEKLVGNTIYWLKDHHQVTILEALNTIMRDYEFYKIRAQSACKTLRANLDPQKQIAAIKELLAKI